MSEQLKLDQGLQRKKRDAQATRKALLAAATDEFQRYGFEAASTRRIAQSAGCNVALIHRYFGSKAEMFETVMEACIDLSPLHGLSREEMVSKLAEIAVNKSDEGDSFDPMIAAIRSSGSVTAQRIIRDQLGDPMVAELASIIGGENAEKKAGILLSIVSGIYVGRVAMGARALSDSEDSVVEALLHEAIRAVLSSELE